MRTGSVAPYIPFLQSTECGYCQSWSNEMGLQIRILSFLDLFWDEIVLCCQVSLTASLGSWERS